MRGASARRTEREQARPPDAAEVIARLERVSDETCDLLGEMRQREAGGGCVSAAQVIDCGDHLAELRNLLEVLAPLIPSRASAYQAGREAGRIEAAAEQAAQSRSAGARHAREHLRPVPGIPATAARAAAAGIVAAGLTGGLAAMHEESSVRPVAASPAATPVLRVMQPPWPAVRIPSASPSPRPSAAAVSARPAPKVTPSPPPASPPPASPAPTTAAMAPALSVPRLLDLGGSIFGQLSLSVTAGVQSVQWTATATDGIRLSSYSGVAVQGQPVTLDVTDGPARGGWVYVSFGGTTVPVEVTTDLAPALPSRL